MHKQQYRITNDHQIIEMLYGDVEKKYQSSLDSELNEQQHRIYIYSNICLYIYWCVCEMSIHIRTYYTAYIYI